MFSSCWSVRIAHKLSVYILHSLVVGPNCLKSGSTIPGCRLPHALIVGLAETGTTTDEASCSPQPLVNVSYGVWYVDIEGVAYGINQHTLWVVTVNISGY